MNRDSRLRGNDKVDAVTNENVIPAKAGIPSKPTVSIPASR